MNIISKHFDIILIGELHGWKKSLDIEKEIIKKVNAKLFLHEMFEDYIITPEEASEDIKSKKWKSRIFSYEVIKPLLKIVKLTKAVGYGSDIHDQGIKDIDNYHVDRDLTPEEEIEEEKLIKNRERKQAKIIINMLKKQRPIIAITGTYHLRKESFLLSQLLKIKNVRILLLYPSTNGLEEEPYYGQREINLDSLSYMKKKIR